LTPPDPLSRGRGSAWANTLLEAAALLGDHDVVGRDVAIGSQSMKPFPGIGRLPVLLVEATDLV
jgi:hypothetical protein